MSDSFEKKAKHTVFIENGNRERSDPYKAVMSQGEAIIFNTTIDAEEGYKLIQPLPNGKENIFTIQETIYNEGLQTIPDHYRLKIKKDSSLLHKQEPPKQTTINISKSQGIQVGDHNNQNITNSIGELISQIDSSNNTTEQKNEAKGKVRELLSNPTIAAILGGTASGLLALL